MAGLRSIYFALALLALGEEVTFHQLCARAEKDPVLEWPPGPHSSLTGLERGQLPLIDGGSIIPEEGGLVDFSPRKPTSATR